MEIFTLSNNVKVLEEGLLNSVIIMNDIPFLLRQDNARTHTAAYTRDRFEPHHVTVLEWPAASSEFKPYRKRLTDRERPCRQTAAQTNRRVENNNDSGAELYGQHAATHCPA